jgi:hypothetical protein
MKLLKETIISTLEMFKFFFISVPVFLIIYSAVNLIFEIKHLTQWKMK